ncbi:hypothetical protein NQZ68_035194 [Dissostichus eleginoides]|nr:hypothetical protein NQZ68_035194 [Dissostichus eleginoides]
MAVKKTPPPHLGFCLVYDDVVLIGCVINKQREHGFCDQPPPTTLAGVESAWIALINNAVREREKKESVISDSDDS